MAEDILSKEPTDTLTDSSKGLLRTVLYFDVFDHPVTIEELKEFSAGLSSADHLSSTLKAMTQAGSLFEFDGYYTVNPKAKALVERRRKAEKMADKARDKAHQRSRFIGRFPYVKAAYISGSMAKGVMYENGDVDFFIITEPG